jgi:hypothetical protein
VLAAVVVVPYEVIVLAATGAGPFAQGKLGFGTSTLLLAIGTFLVTPLISALHAHGVLDVRDGNQPRLGPITRRALAALPTVSAAVIISWLGIAAGFIALVVPGVLLSLRWSVVSQVAALEGKGWTEALSRSRELTRTHYPHIFGLFLLAGVIATLPFSLVGLAFGHSTTNAASFLVGTALQILLRSFTALATALLYFDLSARFQAEPNRPVVEPGPSDATALSGRTVEPTGHPLDPDSYSDEDRPRGWYVDPGAPWKMRYWAADGKPGWSRRTAKTPKQTLAGWHKVNDR